MLAAARPGVARIETILGKGSGLVVEFDHVGRKAIIATRYTLVIGVDDILIVDSQGNRLRNVTFAGSDSGLNLALLEVCCSRSWAALPFESRNAVQAGDAVVAMGHRIESGGPPSSEVGIVSSLQRDASTDVDLIELDISLDPGFDGGPVLSLYGTVVGVNVAGGRIIESDAVFVHRLLNPAPTPVPPELRISGYLNDVMVTQEARLIAALVTSSDPDDIFSAEIDWGDGGGFQPTVVIQATGEILANHLYAEPGFYDVSVRITNQDGYSVAKSIGRQQIRPVP